MSLDIKVVDAWLNPSTRERVVILESQGVRETIRGPLSELSWLRLVRAGKLPLRSE